MVQMKLISAICINMMLPACSVCASLIGFFLSIDPDNGSLLHQAAVMLPHSHSSHTPHHRSNKQLGCGRGSHGSISNKLYFKINVKKKICIGYSMFTLKRSYSIIKSLSTLWGCRINYLVTTAIMLKKYKVKTQPQWHSGTYTDQA